MIVDVFAISLKTRNNQQWLVVCERQSNRARAGVRDQGIRFFTHLFVTGLRKETLEPQVAGLEATIADLRDHIAFDHTSLRKLIHCANEAVERKHATHRDEDHSTSPAYSTFAYLAATSGH